MTLDDVRTRIEPLIRAGGIRSVARAVGITDAALHRWLRGQSSLSFATIQSIASQVSMRLEVTYTLRKSRKNKDFSRFPP